MAATYNFKALPIVPSATDFIDITLSKTQRKTPTVVHNGYAISRIRSFYIRKVRYTSSNFADRLSDILTKFPNLDDIHPFYASLMNVLYDRDHYKLALGQLALARRLIETVAKDYIRLLKYGDSLYRCKTLKRAALGRMCTIMKKQANNLAYLEQVRQHLSRLPSINPAERTLIVCGYPNVGKSSFLNTITRADVDVQPYAFTTKSLFVGHMDYNFVRWQVIDTPGLLDHPLQDMNTIEMQSVTALAHINAAVLFFVDISEQCNYTIEQQVSLFNNIKPLFTGKPLTIVLNKIDVVKPEALDIDDKARLQELVSDDIQMMSMSTMTGDGVTEVRVNACERLLQQRVEAKLASKGVESILNRLHVAIPQDYDPTARPPLIPEEVLRKRDLTDAEAALSAPVRNKKSAKDLEAEAGGPGQYSLDMRQHHMLENDEWLHDVVPEFLDGHNVADFIDPLIVEKLKALELEEEMREKALAAEMDDDSDPEERARRKEAVAIIRRHTKLLKQASRAKNNQNRSTMPRNKSKVNADEFSERMGRMGMDGSAARERMEDRRGRSRSRQRILLPKEPAYRKGKYDQSAVVDEDGYVGGPAAPAGGDVDMYADDDGKRGRKRRRSVSAGDRNVKVARHAERLRSKSQKAWSGRGAKAGEADRHIPTKMPKHLFSGKRGNGKTDRR